MPQNESSIMQHSPHQFRLTIITCCVLLLITAVLLPKDFYPESALHRTLNDHASINSSSLSTVPVAAPSSSILQQQHGLEEKEQQQPLSWPEAHFRMMKLGGDDAINRIPGEECGHNYKRLVEGEAIEEGKSSSSSATSSLLPICRLEDLKSNVSMGYRRSSSSPFEIPGCRLHWFHAKEACELFEKLDIVLAAVGDSLVRHMTQAIITIMIDDYQKGGMRWWDQNENDQSVCQCDMQFRDEPVKCRFYTMADYGLRYPHYQQEDQTKFCAQWTKNRVFFIPEAGPDLGKKESASFPIHSIVNDDSTTRLFVYLSIGLHLNFDWNRGMQGYLEPLQNILLHKKQTESHHDSHYPPRALFATAPYPGPQKDYVKYPRQAKPYVVAWNEHLREFQSQLYDQSTLIDYAVLSQNSTSSDGTHFTQDTNIILAQMVLNYIAALSYEKHETPL